MRRELKRRAARSKALVLHSEPVPSGQHMRVETRPDLHDKLLQLSLDIPVDQGEDHVVEVCVDRLAALLPDSAIAAILHKSGRSEPHVVARLPKALNVALGEYPARLFPGLARERILPLTGVSGSSLHIASSQVDLLDEASFESAFIARAAEVVATGVQRARSFEQAQRAGLELRRLQAKFIQAEKLASLGQIVAGVVHELNNPLSAIVTYSDYLLSKAENAGDDAEDRARLQRIADAAERILKFSRDLVLYARPAKHEPAALSLREVIERALVFCEHEFAECNVRLEQRLPPELPAVRGVFDQLTQVFVNLFTNAAHSMRGGAGTLCVVAAADSVSERILVEVADQGVGIEESLIEQIFEPFFTTKPDGHGTGLGLWIVRDIIQAHGGSLKVTSVPGQGSVFSLCLPIASTKSRAYP